MPLIEWTPALSVGVSVLDADHRKLVELINHLHEEHEANRGAQMIGKILDGFRDHLASHLDREEELLRRAGHVELEEHRRSHDMARARFDEIAATRRDDEEFAGEVLEYMKAWLINHIVCQDLKLREVFQAKGMADVPLEEMPGAGGWQRLAARLDRFKVSSRIALLALIPVALLGMQIANLISSGLDDIRTKDNLIATVDIGVRTSSVIHELQKERGGSALFLGSKGTQFAAELTTQRTATDTAVNAFRQALAGNVPARLRDALKSAETTLAGIGELRRTVDGQTIPMPQAVAKYTVLVDTLVGQMEVVTRAATEADVTRDLGAYINFIKSKERAGRERAVGAAGFAAGQFTPEQYQNFVGLVAEQRAFDDAFAAGIDPSVARSVQDRLKGEAADRIAAMRKAALASLETGSTAGVKAPDWFSAQTARIDMLKGAEDDMAARMARQVAEQREAQVGTLIRLVVISGVAILAIAAFAMALMSSLSPPLLRLTQVMRTLAEGNRTIGVPSTAGRDEIGDIARAVQFFKEKLIAAEFLGKDGWTENKARIAAFVRKQQAIEHFNGRVHGFLTSLAAASNELLASSETMSATATQTIQRSGAVNEASELTRSRVQTAAAATEELSASINEISSQVARTAEASKAAADDATRTNAMVSSLAGTAQKIGEVVSLITDIASQTNLLALNATIEAARAGEAGKGFAVVAGEVKNLANQTARATDEITRQIAAIQTEASSSASAMSAIVGRITEIDSIAAMVAAAVEEQSAATAEISRSMQEVSSATVEVSDSISDVSQAAGQTGDAASAVRDASSELSNQAESLKHEVSAFLDEMNDRKAG
jgi:hemerythrin-like metal-binding protein